MYAAGQIPGCFFRREGRPTDLAILTCRLIDRPLRPSFADGYRNETQVVVTVIGADQREPLRRARHQRRLGGADAVGHPVRGPDRRRAHRLAADGTLDPAPHLRGGRRGHLRARGGRPPGRRRRHRHHDGRGRRHREGLELLRGRRPQGHRGGHRRGPRGLPRPGSASRSSSSASWSTRPRRRPARAARVGRPARLRRRRRRPASRPSAPSRLAEAARIADKAERNAANDEAAAGISTSSADEFPERRAARSRPPPRRCTKKVIRRRIVERGRPHRRPWRPRPAAAVAPRSACCRPPTAPACSSGARPRCSTSLTLGMPKMDQMLDTLGTATKKRYMHHYNMPPYANGETGRVGGPKRREIGHGLLAERALLPVVPSLEEWPYALRLVSEVLSSNGSTSMASVCASSLSLMDGGVPIKAPVAGIAMGLVLRGRQVHHPHRHPRCRGRVRRHGLQGRRHRRLRHRPPARHQDRRASGRRAGRRRWSRPTRPAADPRGDVCSRPGGPQSPRRDLRSR